MKINSLNGCEMVTITVSGTPGSGKTTVAKLLKEKIGLKYVYSGKVFREMARQYGMSLQDFGRYCEKHREIDEKLDNRQIEILKEGDVILEGRLAGWLAHRNNIPAFKILIDADIDVRAKRIVKREGGTVEERKKEIVEREKSEMLRYKKYYDIDLKDTSIYDVVVDSTNLSPKGVIDVILKKMRDKHFL